jgi:hypothetical protein
MILTFRRYFYQECLNLCVCVCEKRLLISIYSRKRDNSRDSKTSSDCITTFFSSSIENQSTKNNFKCPICRITVTLGDLKNNIAAWAKSLPLNNLILFYRYVRYNNLSPGYLGTFYPNSFLLTLKLRGLS